MADGVEDAVSIPEWFDLKSSAPLKSPLNSCFNSYMVRFKDRPECCIVIVFVEFQFLYGSI